MASWVEIPLLMLHGRSQNEVTVSLRSILLELLLFDYCELRSPSAKSWWEERNTEELHVRGTSQDHWFTHGWNILCKSTVWRLTTLFVRWVFGRHVSFSFTVSFKSAEAFQVHWDTEVWFHYLNCIFFNWKYIFFALST